MYLYIWQIILVCCFKGREKPSQQSQANTVKSGVRGRRKDVNTEQWDFFGGGVGGGGQLGYPMN